MKGMHFKNKKTGMIGGIQMYKFQCDKCLIVSGVMSKSKTDAPTCCNGEKMRAIYIQQINDITTHTQQLSFDQFIISTNDGARVTGYMDGEIFSVFVPEHIRGMGIATKLLEKAMSLTGKPLRFTKPVTDLGKILIDSWTRKHP